MSTIEVLIRRSGGRIGEHLLTNAEINNMPSAVDEHQIHAVDTSRIGLSRAGIRPSTSTILGVFVVLGQEMTRVERNYLVLEQAAVN